MKITKEIYCVNKDKDGVIINVGVINEKFNEKGQKTYTSKKKEDFIKEVRDLEKKGNDVEIKTSEGTKVHNYHIIDFNISLNSISITPSKSL